MKASNDCGRRQEHAGIRSAIIVIVALIVTGCADLHYKETTAGTLKGELRLEWRAPDRFVYVPSEDNPLRFIRGESGDAIQPDRIWTDGGSIPRPFWVFKNYSPWGYGPAFVIHDWLFQMQDCELPGYERYDLETAATIMSEVMKTLLEQPDFDYGSKSSMYLMYQAVKSEPARNAWEDHDCQPVDPRVPRAKPDAVFIFSF